VEGQTRQYPMIGLCSIQVGLLSDPWLLPLSSAAFWSLYSLLLGLLANQLPDAWLQRQGVRQSSNLLNVRPRGLLGIQRWNRWIPHAGNALPAALAKPVWFDVTRTAY
jgi:hypothetical protein